MYLPRQGKGFSLTQRDCWRDRAIEDAEKRRWDDVRPAAEFRHLCWRLEIHSELMPLSLNLARRFGDFRSSNDNSAYPLLLTAVAVCVHSISKGTGTEHEQSVDARRETGSGAVSVHLGS